MKTYISLFVLFLTAVSAAFAVENGEKAPDFTLTSADGQTVSLSDYAGKTVVLEWVNPYCPFVKKFYEVGEMQKMQKKAEEMGVVWLAINSTEPNSDNYISPEKSVEYAQENKVTVPWLMDEDGSVGRAYNALRTPHMYVINGDGVLVYQGAIDSIRDANPDSIAKADNYVFMALDALKAGKAIDPDQTRPYGCTIKYAD